MPRTCSSSPLSAQTFFATPAAAIGRETPLTRSARQRMPEERSRTVDLPLPLPLPSAPVPLLARCGLLVPAAVFSESGTCPKPVLRVPPTAQTLSQSLRPPWPALKPNKRCARQCMPEKPCRASETSIREERESCRVGRSLTSTAFSQISAYLARERRRHSAHRHPESLQRV